VITLYKWSKAWRLQGEVVPATQRDPEGWGSADKFTVVLETSGLNSTELAAYCRERGLFPVQVDRWRQAAQDANAQPLLTMADQKDLQKRHHEDQREMKRLKQELRRKGTGGGGGIADRLTKDPGLLGRGRGGLTSPEDRRKALKILDAGMAAGARACKLAELLGVGLTTLQRWRRQSAGDGDGLDRRKGSPRLVSCRLTEEERQRVLLTCNQPEFAALPPGQIVPILTDRGLYNSFGEYCVYGSRRSFYRDLHAHGQAHRRGRARPPQEPRPVPCLRSDGPNQVWSWDITYLPTSVRGVWLYLYLVVDVWSRKIVAWDVAEREDAQVAADLISRACLRERINRRRPQPLILHADNGNAMRAATLKSRLEELGVFRSFPRPRVSNDNPFSESLFRTVKYRPDYPRRPFCSQEEACEWVMAFLDWYNHRHRHSGIRFVTPAQRHSGQAIAIARQRAAVYERARQQHLRRWSRSTRC
jgi:putative transposase